MVCVERFGLVLVTAVAVLGGCGLQGLTGVIESGSSGDVGGSSGTGGSTTGTPATTTGGPDSSGSQGGGQTGGSSSSTGTATEGSSSSDSSSSDSTSPVACEAPPGHTKCDAQTDPVANPLLMFHSIGLGCQGTEFETYPITAPSTLPADADSFRVVREYGNPTFEATEGSNLLALTTGIFGVADGSGVLTVAPGSTDDPGQTNGNPVGDPPAPIDTTLGSGGTPFTDCDGTGDCSDTLAGLFAAGGPARDMVSLSFDIEVPPGTLGYRVDLAWFSAEYPARADTVGTDVAVWWQSSEAFTGNVATLDGGALSASEVSPWLYTNGLHGDVAALDGTGFGGTLPAPCGRPGMDFAECPRGGGTGWLTLTGPAAPDETMTMVVALFDLSDTTRDSVLLVDNWRWFCDGCSPGGDCGLGPLVE